MAIAENKHIWGMKTAARLRAVHASFPELGPEDRCGYLVEEIERALDDAATFPGESRQSLLEAVNDYFPVFGEPAGQPAEPVAAPAATRPEPPAPAAMSVSQMVDELCRRSGELSREELDRLAKLAGRDAVAADGNPVPPRVAAAISFPGTPPEIEDFERSLAQVWLELGIGEDARGMLRLTRLLKMLGILSGGFRDIHRFVWPYWSEMAGRELKHQLKPVFGNGLEEPVGSFVTGGEVGGGVFHQEMETTKRVLIAILVGLRKGAEEFGRAYERKFSPDAVADTVLLEESAADPGKVRDFARKCWDKYSRLAKHQTADAIHDAILQAVAEAACARVKLS